MFLELSTQYKGLLPIIEIKKGMSSNKKSFVLWEFQWSNAHHVMIAQLFFAYLTES